MIELNGIIKTFGDIRSLDDVSVRVSDGSIFA